MRRERPGASIWDRDHLGVTLGAIALVFLAAVEALAVTTVMPVVSAELHGEELFALSLSGPLATGVIGMVVSGAWSDRGGPRAPLYFAILLFMLGLLVAGAAPDIYTFVVGRLVQGLGGGGQIVALYVVVARLYPPELHSRMFASFSAAWVVPAMVGPFLAGAVAEFLHWRWTFFGVAGLTVLAFLRMAPRLRGAPLGPVPDATEGEGAGAGADPTLPTAGAAERAGGSITVRLVLATIVAVAAIGAGFAAELRPSTGWLVAAACVVVAGFAIRPLLPRGTLLIRRGLPSVILMRGVIAGAFFGSETYVPKLMMERFDFTPTFAGLALTVAGLTWTVASFTQGRYGERLGSTRIAMIGIGLMIAGVGGVLVSALLGVAPWLVVVGWGVGGAGMGLLYPWLSVLTLAYSTPQNSGFNLSALSISDSAGAALMIAIVGMAFLTFPIAGSGFPIVYLLAIVLLLFGVVPGSRLGRGRVVES
ncbi:MAG: MFS transporter [Leucobacter sp.]|nr:MFS transporter [Leucobacter sp.]